MDTCTTPLTRVSCAEAGEATSTENAEMPAVRTRTFSTLRKIIRLSTSPKYQCTTRAEQRVIPSYVGKMEIGYVLQKSLRPVGWTSDLEDRGIEKSTDPHRKRGIPHWSARLPSGP